MRCQLTDMARGALNPGCLSVFRENGREKITTTSLRLSVDILVCSGVFPFGTPRQAMSYLKRQCMTERPINIAWILINASAPLTPSVIIILWHLY
jgi:hypothetical protein